MQFRPEFLIAYILTNYAFNVPQHIHMTLFTVVDLISYRQILISKYWISVIG
jgi:hypothetical protein